MTIETFSWKTQIQSGMEGEFTYSVRQAKFGDGYEQVVGDGIHFERQSWPIVLTGNRTEIVSALAFMRRHVTKSFIWTSPLGESAFYRVNADSLKISPLSSQVMTVTATFRQAYAP